MPTDLTIAQSAVSPSMIGEYFLNLKKDLKQYWQLDPHLKIELYSN